MFGRFEPECVSRIENRGEGWRSVKGDRVLVRLVEGASLLHLMHGRDHGWADGSDNE
jgi:hypothetical protein